MGNACRLNVSDEKEEGIKDNSFFFKLSPMWYYFQQFGHVMVPCMPRKDWEGMIYRRERDKTLVWDLSEMPVKHLVK